MEGAAQSAAEKGDPRQEIEREERFVLPTYAKLPFLLVRGEGNEVFDSGGRGYLDLYGGHAVCIIGHSHPRWVDAVRRQAGELGFYSNVCYHPARGEAAEYLVTRSYPGMAQVYFANSGAEANETALKMARRLTGRPRIVAMEGGFHGRTLGPLSVTGSQKLRDTFPENLAHLTDFVPLGDLDAIRKLDPAGVAAVILEPIQSMAGVRLAPQEYYRELRQYTRRHGIALIFDEVQTGMARTGHWFVGTHWDVEPDILTLAKGVGGGFPVGVVVTSRAIADSVQVGDHGSTFGGGPMAAAAVTATFRIIEEENLREKVARHSREVLERLRSLVGQGLVREVRGLGYLIGVECSVPARDILVKLRSRGILAGSSNHPETFRLLPPLTVGPSEWERFFQAFEPIALGRERL